MQYKKSNGKPLKDKKLKAKKWNTSYNFFWVADDDQAILMSVCT